MNRLDEDPLAGAFASYRYTTMVRSPGVARIAAAVRRRRVVRAARTASSIIVLTVIPALVYVLAAPGNRADLPLGPTPALTELPPSEYPLYSPKPSPVEVPTDKVPPGGLAPEALRNAGIKVPAWNATSYPQANCDSGPKKFTDGIAPQDKGRQPLRIEFMGYVDVESDSSYETIAKLSCPQEETGPEQLVVVDGGSGAARQVITSANGVHQIEVVIAKSDGALNIQVNNKALRGDQAYSSAQHQWRSIRWNGREFIQSFGNVKFHWETADNDLKVVLGELVFDRPVNGVRKGTLSITVEIVGTSLLTHALIGFNMHNVEMRQPVSTGPKSIPAIRSYELRYASGTGTTITLDFLTRESDARQVGLSVFAIPQLENAHEGGFSDLLQDMNPRDNEGDGQLAGIPAVVRMIG